MAQKNKVFCPKCSPVYKNTYLGIAMAWGIFSGRMLLPNQELDTLEYSASC